ncbi:uncharacterized protein MELLADRAFT_107915 [Melampsora larici-populina 98AG31]|uniref:Secreted protein n=1 Tax=Melampsora larici-populina (strain 98AG31 / pathotype 3-4-7) TaxID=747676 RepID=F4RRD4_MELLP|nr:uncharacterized protein MELLADRAFT_107915 [Melampsora larici-populina 98AG31]EGG05052.1 secreted protein [Melampsora larici-populina 98AG31]
MLSQLVLGLSLWMPSHAYAGLSPFHTASTLAHQPSEMDAAGTSAHAPLTITWSPGTQEMNGRMAEGAQADRRMQLAQNDLHDSLLADKPKTTTEESNQKPVQLVESVEHARLGEWTLRARKLLPGDKAQTAFAPTTQDLSETTTLVAPSINTMRTYDAEELLHIEKKARELKLGFDYTYLGHGTFVRDEKTKWDIHGLWGQIRVYDKDEHKLLYETDCCYCGGQGRSSGDYTTGEDWIQGAIGLCGFVACTSAYVAFKLFRETL